MIPTVLRGRIGRNRIDQKIIMYCVIVDITEQKMMIKDLELEKESFDLLVQASNDIIFDINVEEATIIWSKLYKEIFGFECKDGLLSNEELANIKSEQITARMRNISSISSFVQEAIKNKKTLSRNILLEYSNGDMHWYRILLHNPIKNGMVIRLVGKLESIDRTIDVSGRSVKIRVEIGC